MPVNEALSYGDLRSERDTALAGSAAASEAYSRLSLLIREHAGLQESNEAALRRLLAELIAARAELAKLRETLAAYSGDSEAWARTLTAVRIALPIIRAALEADRQWNYAGRLKDAISQLDYLEKLTNGSFDAPQQNPGDGVQSEKLQLAEATICGLSGKLVDAQYALGPVERANERLRAELVHRQEADLRGVAKWRAEKPRERELTRPDHADLVAWLLDVAEAAEARAEATRLSQGSSARKYFWQFQRRGGEIFEVQIPSVLVGRVKLRGVSLVPEIGRWLMTLACDDGPEIMLWMPSGYSGDCVNTGWREEVQA